MRVARQEILTGGYTIESLESCLGDLARDRAILEALDRRPRALRH